MHQSHSDLADIIARFHIEGRLVALKQTNEGHINDTFFSTFDEQERFDGIPISASTTLSSRTLRR